MEICPFDNKPAYVSEPDRVKNAAQNFEYDTDTNNNLSLSQYIWSKKKIAIIFQY